jgi:hypothetical protein
MATKRISLNELKNLVKKIIKEENTLFSKKIYFTDIDKKGIITKMNDKIVEYYFVSDSDGERYDQNLYKYIRSHFDELVKNGRIEFI